MQGEPVARGARSGPAALVSRPSDCHRNLLGTTPALIEAGIPDEAYTALRGDDRKVVSALKKRNKTEREGQLSFAVSNDKARKALSERASEVRNLPDDDIDALLAAEREFERLQASSEHERARWAADAWCAAFMCEKTEGAPAITTGTVRGPRGGSRCRADRSARGDTRVARRHRFLHWHVAFPEVFRAPSRPEQPANASAAGTVGSMSCSGIRRGCPTPAGKL